MDKNSMTINFNNETYIAVYNPQSGYYEVDLQAPTTTGGIYKADVEFTDLFGQEYEDSINIQILAKEQIKIETNKILMWIFDYRDLKLKDIVEAEDNYEINIDEETNAVSTINVVRKTTARTDDIVFIKKDNDFLYWGVIDNIQNTDGNKLYQYTLKYITNMFNQDIILNQDIINTEDVEEGYYRIHNKLNYNSVFDVLNGSLEAGANLQIYEINNTNAQKFKISKREDGTYKITNVNSGMVVDVQDAAFENGTNVQMWGDTDNDAQKWTFTKRDNNSYSIFLAGTNFVIDLTGGNTANGGNIEIWDYVEGSQQELWILEKLDEETIRNEGIEDYIAEQIKKNFINNIDKFVNREYLQINVKTHTKINASVSTIVDVQDGIFNLHTFMTNCTQLYNINYNFEIMDKKLILTIENKEAKKELIDVNAQPIAEYTEVFETNIVSKVVVVTANGEKYTLYLKADRTTTEDINDKDRAAGNTETVYAENLDDARQKALDTLKANAYNHSVSFKYFNRYITIGTPVTLKTKDSLILDTYISAIKLTANKFIEYTCGNVRVDFIDKLLKERKK